MKVGSLRLLLGLASVACVAPPGPLAPDSALLGVRIDTQDPLGLSETPSLRGYFIRLDASGQLLRESVLPSNYAADDYVYLLNAEPGTYAVVAVGRDQDLSGPPAAPTSAGWSFSAGISPTAQMTTYLPEEAVRLTTVNVPPGGAAFMGEFVVGLSEGMEEAEPLQQHYYRLLQPDAETQGLMSRMLSLDFAYRGTLKQADQGAAALQRFLTEARDNLAEAGWTPVLERLGS